MTNSDIPRKPTAGAVKTPSSGGATTPSGGGAFLDRWSRRKAAARQAEPVDDQPPPQREASAATSSTAQPVAPKAALTEADFADVNFEALDYGSEYGRFMQSGVPEAIRKKALQKLWLSDPIFTQVDPFNEYAGDYTDAAVAAQGPLKTAYKIGRGFLTEQEAADWDKLGKPVSEHAAIDAAAAIGILAENPDQPEIAAFFAASEAYMAALYPAESNHFVDIASLQKPNVLFLVARRRGAAVGCGAIVRAEDGTAEIKRMWVDPEVRREQVAKKLLAELIDAARGDGVTAVQLETGTAQPAAEALYRRAGFTDRGPFGTYVADPLSLFMELRLAKD
jgi:putative acetyltransferase